MKKLVAFMLMISAAGYCYAQGNALDMNFGQKGKVVTTIRYGAGEYVHSLACQSDGKIIAGGYFGSPTPGMRSVMLRYNTDGSIDRTFGNQGNVQTAYPGIGISKTGLVSIQKLSGIENILLADYRMDSSYLFYIVVNRYKPDGTKDTSFGTAGDAQISHRYLFKMKVAPDEKILLATLNDTIPKFEVLRCLQNGQIDSSFGVNGSASRWQDSFSAITQTIALQKDGKVLAGGHVFVWPTNPDTRMAVTRYTANGDVDSSFGKDGLVLLTTNQKYIGGVTGIGLQSDNKIVVSATCDSGTGSFFYLTRLLTDGTTDSSFGNDGHMITIFGSAQCWAQELLVQDDDKLYIAGYASPGAGNQDYTFAIARYTKDGILDNTFGVKGEDTTNVGRRSLGLAAAITPNHSIVVGGYSSDWAADLTEDFTLLRYLSGLELGILHLAAENKPVVYPNPVSGVINIAYETEKEEILTFKLVDMNGRTVQVFEQGQRKSAGKHKDALQLNSNITSGQYLLQVLGTQGSYGIKLQVAL